MKNTGNGHAASLAFLGKGGTIEKRHGSKNIRLG
jgi:hypothetical protein